MEKEHNIEKLVHDFEDLTNILIFDILVDKNLHLNKRFKNKYDDDYEIINYWHKKISKLDSLVYKNNVNDILLFLNNFNYLDINNSEIILYIKKCNSETYREINLIEFFKFIKNAHI